MNFRQAILRIVGFLNVAISVLGLAMSCRQLPVVRLMPRIQPHIAAFWYYFVTSVLLLVCLLLSGVMLLIGRRWAGKLALFAYGAEVLYLLFAADIPGPWGTYVTGSVGLAPQMFCLYPIWAGALVWWSNRRTFNPETAR